MCGGVCVGGVKQQRGLQRVAEGGSAAVAAPWQHSTSPCSCAPRLPAVAAIIVGNQHCAPARPALYCLPAGALVDVLTKYEHTPGLVAGTLRYTIQQWDDGCLVRAGAGSGRAAGRQAGAGQQPGRQERGSSLAGRQRASSSRQLGQQTAPFEGCADPSVSNCRSSSSGYTALAHPAAPAACASFPGSACSCAGRRGAG